MRGLSLRALTAAFALLLTAPLSCSSAAPSLSGLGHGGASRTDILRVADDESDDRDIIRLLPPGSGSSSSAPSTPELPFPPVGGGDAVPGQGLRLSGQSIQVPIAFQPWPGQEQLAYVGIRLDGVNDPALASALGLDGEAGIFVVDTTPGAPGAQAGLRFGDFVTALDGTPITHTSEFLEAVKARTPGSQGTLTVWRVGDDATGYLSALRDLADRGSTPAMMFLARLYTNGTGVQRDAEEAVSWFKKAALAGSTNGMLLYGDALASGTGTVKDVTEAQRWIRKSAESGNVAALFRLGRMYRDGEGLMRDPLEAINLFKKAAEANYTPAMVAVGLMFEGGGGLEADHLQAVQWYKRAADLGDAEGMAALGTMYSTGRGVEKNPATAAAWYIEAAKRGQLLAIHNLAYHYDKGIGVSRDPNMAAGYIYQALERRYQFTYQQMMQNSRAWSRDFRRALQQRLAAGGYYSGSVDGAFGRTTFDAINAMVQAQ
ncbi:PDZ domain-containing protein [Hyphomicrobium sp.]|uniref:PDZ domain-containing protein n=1 Tax=Hyphomicrobium sp. TaxID=82 RepID=UPI0025C1A53C|nr:PDZ domain-containing protein [Hyphomicrobium sp.]MCC7252159.1 SEL1-like repeat protein [Hyphomicrobium sp.]